MNMNSQSSILNEIAFQGAGRKEMALSKWVISGEFNKDIINKNLGSFWESHNDLHIIENKF